jgi:23S rRNA (cytosine1962-C5)-methyltransferase
MPSLPCILFEDDDLLVINKPAGIVTHRTGEFEPWGIVEILESRLDSSLQVGVHQRLDRETSGIMVFSKSAAARRSLAQQFEGRTVRKRYVFATQQTIAENHFCASEPIQGKPAQTGFQYQKRLPNGLNLWEATPETGRTHQVRIHAARHGLPIAGEPDAKDSIEGPLLLHALRLELRHPSIGQTVTFDAPLPSYFESSDAVQRRLAVATALRSALIDEKQTDAWRWIHRATDGFPKFTLDRYGDWLYLENYEDGSDWKPFLESVRQMDSMHPKGIILASVDPEHPRQEKRLIEGTPPPEDLTIRENGIRYRVQLLRPGATGLFLDQRENRRRIRSLAKGKRVLNLFSYTCGFSVAAAVGGAEETVNVDLSRPSLDWGRENFRINQLDPSPHQFMAADVWDALGRFRKKQEPFDIILIDPPSSSRSRSGGHFSARKDFPRLVANAVPLLRKGGWLFCSCNLATWKSPDFAHSINEAIRHDGRHSIDKLWVPQPFDYPTASGQPPYFKSIWLQLG